MVGSSEKYDRYPGLNAFSIEQSLIFFGRTREVNELYEIVLLEKAVTLYAQSGVGKSSLLNAGLIPKLRSSGYLTIKVRFKDWDKEDASPINTFKDILSPFFHIDNVPGGKLPAELRLWEYFKGCRFPAGFYPVIIFDQFEEFFYFSQEKRFRFATELAELQHEFLPNYVFDQAAKWTADEKEAFAGWVSQPDVKMVFSIRSDRLFELNELSYHIPLLQRSRFELRPLTRAAVLECICEPAKKEGWYFSTLPFSYTQDSLSEILETLGKEKDEVESSQLQIICDQIERKVRLIQEEKGMNEDEENYEVLYCSPGLYGGITGLQSIIENYYKGRLETFTDPQKRMLVENFFEKELIKDDKRMILREPLAKKALNNDMTILTALLDLRLIREDFFKGDKIFEVSHDSLVSAIVNERRRKEELLERDRRMRDKQNADVLHAKMRMENYYDCLAMQQLDEAEKCLKDAIDLYSPYEGLGSAKVKTMLSLARLYVSKKDYESSSRVLDEAEIFTIKLDNKKLQGQVNELRASQLELDVLDATSVDVYNKALDLFRDSRSYPELARLSENIAVLLEAQVDADINERVIQTGIDFYEQALENYKLTNDIPSIKRINRSLLRLRRLIKPFAYLTDLITGKSYPLIGNKTIFIGRATANIYNDISFPSLYVSRRQVIITPDLMINDLQSTNGTQLNAAPLQYGFSPTLSSGDIVVLGNTIPLFFSDEPIEDFPEDPKHWGVFINGTKREITFLGEAYYTVALDREKNEFILYTGRRPESLLEIFEHEGKRFCRLFSEGVADAAGMDGGRPWELIVLSKDKTKKDSPYSELKIEPGQPYIIDAVCRSSCFVLNGIEENDFKTIFFQFVLRPDNDE